MKTYFVQETAVINAPPAHVYSIVADYHEGHQAILPREYFDEMIVTKGGQGAGTELIVRMSVLGTKVEYNMVVTEPEPGRVIQEEDASAGTATTFTIEPTSSGEQSQVTIQTAFTQKPGLQGWLEKLINPSVTRRVYRAELANLNRVASSTAQPIS